MPRNQNGKQGGNGAGAGAGAGAGSKKPGGAAAASSAKRKPRRRRASQVLAAGISRFVAVGNQRSRKKQKDDAKAESERRNIAALKSLKFMKAKVLDHKYNVTLVKGKGIPVREGVQLLYTLLRDDNIRRALMFMVHFICFLFVVSELVHVHSSFTTDDAVEDLILGEAFGDATYEKNFYEIMTQGEFWTWVQDPMTKGLYPDEWYNGEPFKESELGYINFYLRLVGGVQFRQLRMSNASCFERRFVDITAPHYVNGKLQELPRFDTRDGTCFADFSVSKQDTEPFGPPEDPKRYKWSNGHSTLTGLFGFGPSYGTGGYIVELPATNEDENATKLMQQLVDDLWTDRSTRAVAVNFNLYNTNTKLLTVVRILVEFFSSGHVVKSAKVFTLKLVVYESKMDLVRMGVEAIYLGGVFVSVVHQVRSFCANRRRCKYFRSFASLYDLLILALQAITVGTWSLYLFDSHRATFDVNEEHYVDMFDMAETATLAVSWAAVLGLACFMKAFQFLSLSKKLNTLWLTMERAMADLAAFMVAFVVVVSGFAYAAMQLFGFVLVEFHTFSSSFSTLLRFILGLFEYQALAMARPAIAPVFFMAYIGVVFMVVLNMFIAIVTKYFDEVHAEVHEADRWQHSAPSFGSKVLLRCSLCWNRCCGCCRRRSAAQKAADGGRQKSYRAEQRFMKLLLACNKKTLMVHNMSLYEYFYKQNQQPSAQHVYIGVHELCFLTNPIQCQVGKHRLKSRKCLAFKTLEAYNEWKSVILVGNIKKHKLVGSDVKAQGLQLFIVRKTNMNGAEQTRMVCIDLKRQAMLNFDSKMKLRKTLPLTHLVQLEARTADDARIAIVFADPSVTTVVKGFTETGEKTRIKPETRYDLRFLSSVHKDEFLKQLLKANTMVEERKRDGGPDVSDMSKKDAGDGLSQRAKGVTQRAARRAQMIVEAQRLMEELSHRVEAMQRFA